MNIIITNNDLIISAESLSYKHLQESLKTITYLMPTIEGKSSRYAELPIAKFWKSMPSTLKMYSNLLNYQHAILYGNYVSTIYHQLGLINLTLVLPERIIESHQAYCMATEPDQYDFDVEPSLGIVYQ